jgi:hypothetical protein
MFQNQKKEARRVQNRLMYRINKIMILVDILHVDRYHYNLYLVKSDILFQMNIIMMLILVTVIRF